MAKKRLDTSALVKTFNSSKRPSKKALLQALIDSDYFDSYEKIKSVFDTFNINAFVNNLNIEVHCTNCKSKEYIKYGYNSKGLSIYKCKNCKRKYTILSDTIFDTVVIN